MKRIVYILLALHVFANAQQVPMYTQYVFNKAGLNPAASGTDHSIKVNYLYGINRQWSGISGSPLNNFVNISYTLKPPREYLFWQNFGFYFDSDDYGLMGSNGVYGSYTMHRLIQKKTVLSIGVMAGARQYTRDMFLFDFKDPAVQNSRSQLWVYPDIIPGIRISGKKFFIGAAMRQISITSLKNFKGRKIGSPSLLYPNLYIDAGKNIEIAESVLMMPSIAINMPLVAPPTLDASLMFYFMNRVGTGVSIRNTNFVSGIFQIKMLQSMTLGVAYSYPINQTRLSSGHSFEMMLGVVPYGMSNKLVGTNSIARCPTLSY